MRKWYAAVIVVVALSVAGVAQEIRRDGRWEVTMEMQMPGMQMPPTTVTQCVTKEEAADPQKAVPPQGRGGPANDCKVSDFKQVGGKLTYTMTCTKPQPMTMKADMNYGVDKYNGTMTMSMARGGQETQVTTKYSAKRLGDCTATK